MEVDKQIEGLYFFMFSEGSYSDYRTGGAYVCDHGVTSEEWDAHYGAYLATVEAKYKELVTASYRDYALHRAQYVAYHAWKTAQGTPEDAFVALHGMVPIGVTEMWRDSQ